MYSINKKFTYMIDEIIKFIKESICEISLMYPGMRFPDFYGYKFNMKADEKLNSIIHNFGDEIMCTVATGTCDDDQNITRVNTLIIMRYVELYEIIIMLNMDMDKIKEILYLIIRHEIGHVYQYSQFVGKTRDDWINYHNLADQQISELPKLRINANSKNRLKFIIDYNSKVITEIDANRNAGITVEDWVRYFNILSGNKGRS